jgi:putative salt-induced outer membrane protein YdiY
VSVGGGVSLTGGNTESNSYNLSFSVVHDPKTKNVFKAEGLYLRSDADGEATADRLNASVRDEYGLWSRGYAFAQLGYLRDRFKEVDYLLSPGAGLGYRFVETDAVVLAADASLGGAFERLTDRDGTSDLALQAGERFDWKVSGSAKIQQKSGALWKTKDFGDAYYRFELSLATTIATRLELKLTFADDYKTRPPRPELKKNDTAFIAALVYKP